MARSAAPMRESRRLGARGVDRFEAQHFTAGDDDALLARSEIGVPERYAVAPGRELDPALLGDEQDGAAVDAHLRRGVDPKADACEPLVLGRRCIRGRGRACDREAADLDEPDPPE